MKDAKQLSSTPTCSSTSLESLNYEYNDEYNEQQQQIKNTYNKNSDMIAAWTIHHIPRISRVITDLVQVVMKLKRSYSLPVTRTEWNNINFIRRS